MSAQPKARDTVINIRAPIKQRELIDRAAAAQGRSRSEFMLDAARRAAEDVLADRRIFILDDEQWHAFMDILDDPSPPSRALIKTMKAKPIWES